MDHFEIWVDVKDSHRDLEFAERVAQYLGELKSRKLIHDFRVKRRKLGWGPPELPEWNITILVENMAQLEQAFGTVARRDGPIEDFHRAVYTQVTSFKSALYRDFPDPQRVRPPAKP